MAKLKYMGGTLEYLTDKICFSQKIVPSSQLPKSYICLINTEGNQTADFVSVLSHKTMVYEHHDTNREVRLNFIQPWSTSSMTQIVKKD